MLKTLGTSAFGNGCPGFNIPQVKFERIVGQVKSINLSASISPSFNIVSQRERADRRVLNRTEGVVRHGLMTDLVPLS